MSEEQCKAEAQAQTDAAAALLAQMAVERKAQGEDAFTKQQSTEGPGSTEESTDTERGEQSAKEEEEEAAKNAALWLPPPAMGTAAERVFIFFDDANATRGSKWMAIFVMVVILVSTAAFVAESTPGARTRPAACRANGAAPTVVDCEPVSGRTYELIEMVCIAIFTTDYIARMFTVPFVRAHLAGIKVRQGRDAPSGARVLRKYATQPLNVIDFLAIAPFYIELGVGGGGSQLAVIRVLRLARILRIFKMGKHNKGMQMLAKVLAMSVPALNILTFYSVIATVLFGACFYFFEGQHLYSVDPQFTNATLAAAAGRVHFPVGVYVRPDVTGHVRQTVSPVRSIAWAFWWVLTTITTVGYGDLFPTTFEGKLVGIIAFYVGVITLALPITILGMNFENCYQESFDSEYKELAKQKKEDGRQSELNAIATRVRRDSVMIMDEMEQGGKPWFLPRIPGASLRRRIFNLFEDPDASRLGKMFSIFILFIIIASCTTFVLETMPGNLVTPAACNPAALDLEACTPTSKQVFKDMEFIFIMIFTVEYLGRLLTVHAATTEEAGLKKAHGSGLRTTLAYQMQMLNVIDVVAILPWYVEKITGSGGGGLAVLRVLRLARVFRVFKMGKYGSLAKMVITVVGDSMPSLSMLFFMSVLSCVLFASCMFFAEGTSFSVAPEWIENGCPYGCYVRPTVDGYGEEISPFVSIPFGFWWFFTTTTTVGYGDFYPTTTAGKFVGVLTFFAGIVLLSLPITVLGGNFSSRYNNWIVANKFEEEQEEEARVERKSMILTARGINESPVLSRRAQLTARGFLESPTLSRLRRIGD